MQVTVGAERTPPPVRDRWAVSAARDAEHREHGQHWHIEIYDSDRVAASADVTLSQNTVRTARASLRAAAGQLAPGARTRLVDAVLDLPGLGHDVRLEASFPLGDSEILLRFRERCIDVTTRPAGATVLLEATIEPAIQEIGAGSSES